MRLAQTCLEGGVATESFKRIRIARRNIIRHRREKLLAMSTHVADVPRSAESPPEFVSTAEQGRTLDLWDAAAVSLGEDQTVP